MSQQKAMLAHYIALSKGNEFDAAGQWPDGAMEFWYRITEGQREKFPAALTDVYGLMVMIDSSYRYDCHRLFASHASYMRAIDNFEMNSAIKRREVSK